jgi:hypothetical protein
MITAFFLVRAFDALFEQLEIYYKTTFLIILRLPATTSSGL